MAHIIELFDDEGNVRAYQVRWREGSRSPSRTFITLKEAEQHQARMIVSKLDGTALDTAAGRQTVRQYGEWWRESQPVADSTNLRRERIMRLAIYPRLGAQRVGAVRPTEIQAWIKARQRAGITPLTLAREWDVLAGLFRAAVADRLIPSSPCEAPSVSAPERTKTRRPTPPSYAQLAGIVAELPERWRRMPLLIGQTGLRPSEAIGLTVGQLDMRPGRAGLTVDHRGGSVKTRTSERTILLTRHARETLELQLAEFGTGPGGRVFHHPDGRPILLNTCEQTWKRVLERLGYPTDKRSAWHLHDLRHLNITSQIQAGAPPWAVMEAAGHSSLTTTELYGHVRHEDRAAAVRALERAMDEDAPSTRLEEGPASL